MRAAIVMLVLFGASAVHADCPPVKKLALAYGDHATPDELARFEAALAPLAARHCSAAARKERRAWTAEASDCVAKAADVLAVQRCIGKAPAALQVGLADDAAATFPYSVERSGSLLVVHGPFTLAHTARALDAVAAYLKANPAIVVEVAGFALEGGPARQRAESQARADQTRAYLVKAGVDGARLTAVIGTSSKAKERASLVKLTITSGRTVTASTAPAAKGATPTERAKLHYVEGEKAYNLGDYDKAIQSFEASRREVPHAALLFNIGQAYKQKGDKASAISYFEQYLLEAPQNAARVQPIIDALRNSP